MTDIFFARTVNAVFMVFKSSEKDTQFSLELSNNELRAMIANAAEILNSQHPILANNVSDVIALANLPFAKP